MLKLDALKFTSISSSASRLRHDAVQMLRRPRRLQRSWSFEDLLAGLSPGLTRMLVSARGKGLDLMTRAWRRVLLVFPLPAEMKWHESLNLQAIFLHTLVEEQQRVTGSPSSADVAGRTLFLSGKRWIRANSPPGLRTMGDHVVLAEVITRAFKSMNIRSRVTVDQQGVTVLNLACPLLEWAEKHHQQPANLCQVFCGEEGSFFRGVSSSYPVYIRYESTHMMGRGHPMCKKRFLTR